MNELKVELGNLEAF